MIIPTHVGYM